MASGDLPEPVEVTLQALHESARPPREVNRHSSDRVDTDSDDGDEQNAPALASRANIAPDTTADQKGVDKANDARRKDFSSAYAERANKRLRSEEKRFEIEMAWRQKQHEQEIEFRKDKLKIKSEEQKYRAIEKREEERNKLVIQLLQSGMPVDQVKSTVAAFFPPAAEAQSI